MKKVFCVILGILMLSSFLALPASAAIFQITYYTEDVYAGGIIDMYVFPDGGVEPYTYQWQVDLGIGSGHWSDLEENDSYKGTKTDHMQLCTIVGNYGDWENIPFQCVVTDAEGTTFYSPNIYARIYPTDQLVPYLESHAFGLYEPTIANTTGLKTTDYVNYTASTLAGNSLNISIGSKPVEGNALLSNSEVKLTREIHITENGHTTIAGDQTTYVPYTVGANAVTVEFKLHLTISTHDLGYFDTKTVKLNVSKPTVASTAKTTADCSLLRYTYNESQKLASIPKGTSVEVLSKVGSYYQVFYNNMVGYVGTSLLNVQQPSYDPVIKTVDVVIDEPVAGRTPAFTCNIPTPGCQLYKTDPITWTDKQTGKLLTAQDIFQEGHSYTLSIWLAAKDGYKFQVDTSNYPDLTGAINGDRPPFIYKAYEQDPEEVVELIYDFNNVKSAPEAPHVCTPVLKPRTEPTCTDPGQEAYYYCSCGMRYQDSQGQIPVNTGTWGLIPATGHQVSGWRTTQVYHYKVCTLCGDLLTQEDHTGGKALCERQALCTVCQTPYGSFGDHPYEAKWTPIGVQGHAHMCENCDTHDMVLPHTPGPEATEDTPQICKDCDYIITPAKNHTHNLTKVDQTPATCTREGNMEYYTCDGCSERFADGAGKNKIPDPMSVTLGALGHTPSEAFFQDGDYHWRTCSTCNEVLIETKMLHEMESGVCTTCGYKAGTAPAAPTEPADTKPQGKDPTPSSTAPQREQTPKAPVSMLSAVLIGVMSFSIAITATVIILKKKK